MNRTMTPALMQQTEKRAFDQGVPALLLMENAARGIAEVLDSMLNGKKSRVLFAAGSGNNGGDAIAAARIYREMGGEAVLWLQLSCKTDSARQNLAFARYLGIEVCESLPEGPFDAAVDGLLGTGLQGAARGDAEKAIEQLNALSLPVLAIDIASGIDGTSGAHGAAVKATVTAALHRVKPGTYLVQPRSLSGKVLCLPIGLPQDDNAEGIFIYEKSDLPHLLPPRAMDAHKGTCGRVSLLCGSMGMAGAAAMAAESCLRAGAGLVTVLCDREVMPILQTLVPNAMCAEPEKVGAFDALLMGCGLPVNDEQHQRMLSLYDPEKPTVLDAGALRMLAKAPFMLGKKTILTPHAGEAAALLGVDIASVLSDPVAAAKAILRKYGCGVVVLKNAVTVICDETRVALNVVGSPALAKGGSGDLLAGLMAGLLPTLPDAFEAACTACLWMGCAGELAEERFGTRSPLTRDILTLLTEVTK